MFNYTYTHICQRLLISILATNNKTSIGISVTILFLKWIWKYNILKEY